MKVFLYFKSENCMISVMFSGTPLLIIRKPEIFNLRFLSEGTREVPYYTFFAWRLSSFWKKWSCRFFALVCDYLYTWLRFLIQVSRGLKQILLWEFTLFFSLELLVRSKEWFWNQCCKIHRDQWILITVFTNAEVVLC